MFSQTLLDKPKRLLHFHSRTLIFYSSHILLFIVLVISTTTATKEKEKKDNEEGTKHDYSFKSIWATCVLWQYHLTWERRYYQQNYHCKISVKLKWIWPKSIWCPSCIGPFNYYCYYYMNMFHLFHFCRSLTYLYKVDSNIIWWRESIVCTALVLSKVCTLLQLHTLWTDATFFLFQLRTIRFSQRDSWNRNSICLTCQFNCLTNPWGIIGGESNTCNQCLVCWRSENKKLSQFI